MSYLRNKENPQPGASIGQQIGPGVPKPWVDLMLAGTSFDDLVKQHGLEFTLYRSAPCPNFVSNTNEHRDDCHNPMCADGQLYIKNPSTIFVVVSGKTGSKNYEAGGTWDRYQAIGLFPATDNAGNAVVVGVLDKIVPIDHTILAVTYSILDVTASEVNRAKYPIEAVEFCSDADGNQFFENDQFCLLNGMIKWFPGKKPVYDPARGPTKITIRYTYKPYFIVAEVMSADLRIHVGLNPYTNQKESMRLPASFVLYREFHQNFKGDTIDDATDDEIPSNGAKNILPK